MRAFSGGCHCRAVTYVLRWPGETPPEVRQCGCSYCQVQQPLYAGQAGAALSVAVDRPDLIARYQHGTKTADFCFCARCGVFLFVTSTITGQDYAVVNARSLDDRSIYVEVGTKDFDGEGSGERLARRSRNWIAEVVIGPG